MDSAKHALAQAAKNDPNQFARLCSDARHLMNHAPFVRLFSFLAQVCAKDELSFAPMPGAQQIDTHLAALREGGKIPLQIIERLAEHGKRITERDDGVVSKHTPEAYHAEE